MIRSAIYTVMIWSLYGLSFTYANESRYTLQPTDTADVFQGVYQSTLNGKFPLAIGLYVDSTFTSSDRKLIREAVGIFVQNALNPEVLKCAYQNSTKDLPVTSTEFEKSQMLKALIPQRLSQSSNFGVTPLFISRIWDEYGVSGIARVGIYNWNKHLRKTKPKKYEKSFLHIALNSDYLGSDAYNGLTKRPEYWAGAIAHEVLHNFSYRHPTGLDGSFLDEYKRCFIKKEYQDTYGYDNWSKSRSKYY